MYMHSMHNMTDSAHDAPGGGIDWDTGCRAGLDVAAILA